MDAEGFIRNHMQQLVRTNPTPELLSMPYHQHPDFTQNIESLPHELKRIFHILFNVQKSKISLKEVLPFKPKKSNVAYCHRMLTPKVDSYRCFDCQIHPDSLLCEDCFKKGNHEGHRYVQLKEEGDCDCGSKSLIKEAGFCPQHCGAQEIIEIDSSEEFVFNLYMRQLFIWILKLIKIEPKDGEILLLYLLAYLAEINELSPYYNKLTTHALFAENDPIADHIFYITLNAAERGKLIQAYLSLFFKMLPLKEFKHKLLISLINNYNRVDGFETSKYVKLFYPLLNEPEVVLSAMTANPIALRPERQFNIMAFYKDLAIIKDIAPNAAQAFLKPLLLADSIIFPFLGRIQERCQKMNNLIVTVFPEFQNEEHVYYKLLMGIIKVIEDKEILAAMIVNYCKVILQYSFKKNKIILVPQRMLVLLIYKYFDFDLQKVKAQEVKILLGLDEEVFHQQIIQNWTKFAQCLFEFSLNLTRTNYFDNYLNLYVREKGQIICIDYLGFKIMAALCKYCKDSFSTVLEHIFRVDNDYLNREKEEQCDIIKARNIFLKIVIQIIYSPRTELVIKTLLGSQDVHLLPFFRLLCHSTGQLTQQQLQNVGQLFYFKELSRELIDSVLTFDPSKRKYVPRSAQQGEAINLQFFVSLLQTKFSKFIQRKNEPGRYLHLDEKQEELKEALLNCKTLCTISMKQLVLIQGHPDDKILIRDLIRTLKIIKLAYKQHERDYDGMLSYIVNKIKQRYIPTSTEECQNRQFLQEIEKELSNNARPILTQQNNEKQAQKRKELLRLKKQKVMKAKKIKQNQQKFLEPQKQQEEDATQEMCLICRQNKDIDQICYVGKMRFTSLLHEFMQAPGDNAIFKSCFHTVHYDCFMRMEKTREAASCPLCKCAINIVLPLENNHRYGLLEKISSRIQHVLNFFILNSESKEKRGFILEAILYFAYLFAVNINHLDSIGQRQLRLCRILSNLLEHNMEFQERQERAEAYYQLFYNKLKAQNDVLFYRHLVNLMQALIFWNANSKSDVEHPLECLYSLSFHCSTTKISQILRIINGFISPPQVSALEPIIIAFEEISPKISQQDEDVSIVKFWTPPADIHALLKLRDINAVQCNVGHQICVCSICQRPFCFSCKKTSEHATEDHPRECLFFNTYSGGFLYYFQGLEVVIRCLYTNDIGKTWKPELPVDRFFLDEKVYADILGELKGGSMFNYLISTFQGLKGNNIADRI